MGLNCQCCACRVHRLQLPLQQHLRWTALRLLYVSPAMTPPAEYLSSTGMLHGWPTLPLLRSIPLVFPRIEFTEQVPLVHELCITSC